MAWLLTWFVQSAALCAVTAVFVRLPGVRARAAARAAAWSVALAGMVLLGLLPLVAGLSSAPVVHAAATAPGVAEGMPALVTLPAVPAKWLAAGATVWALGALAWLAYLAGEVLRVRRLKQACEPFTPDEQHRVQPWLDQAAGGRQVIVRWCERLDGPALLGFRRPVVALPRVHGERLTDEELQHVLLHEVAHLRRRDDWFALAELVAAGLLWINPLVHAARRSLSLAREMACDEWVVRQTSAPAAYARCLTAVADLRQRLGRSRLAAAATGTRSLLSRRVMRVLEVDRRRSGARSSRLLALVTPIAVGVLAIALIQTPPLVVDGAPGQSPGARAPETVPAQNLAPVSLEAERTTDPGRTVKPRAVVTARSAGTRASAQAPPQELPVHEGDLPAEARPGADVQTEVAPAPLSASPVPGVGTPGVPVAGVTATAMTIVPDEHTPWWGRAARVGTATSEGATTAGRATASFFKRLGSSVSPSPTR